MKVPLRMWSAVVALLITLGPGGGSADAALTCGKVTTFADGKTPTREIHVRVNGNDTTGDGSTTKPFATVQKAASHATPGTAIRIHAGTYATNQYIENLAGTATAPIWIGGAPGETPPVFSGGIVGLQFVKVKYLVVHDIQIQWTSSHGINIHDKGETWNFNATRFVVFQKMNIHDAGGQCLKMAGVNDFRVLNSQFARCGIVNIDGVGVHNGVIAYSTIGPSEHGVQVKGGSYNVEIHSNRIKNITNRALNLGGSTGFTYFRPPLTTTGMNYEAWDIRAVGNIIENSKSPVAIVGCANCYVANNTIINPSTFIFRILQETRSTATYQFSPARNGLIYNNLIYFNRAAIVYFTNVGPYTSPTTFQYRNNLWYAYNDPSKSKPTDLPVAESGGVYGVNPNFLNPGSGLYPLLVTSPAAGKGLVLGSLFERYATGDFDGSCWLAPPSIGAFESTTGALSTSSSDQ